MCARPSVWNKYTPNGRLFVKFRFKDFIQKIFLTFKFWLKTKQNTVWRKTYIHRRRCVATFRRRRDIALQSSMTDCKSVGRIQRQFIVCRVKRICLIISEFKIW